MSKQNQEKEFKFPPMRVLDRKTKELIKVTVSNIVVHLCVIHNFKMKFPIAKPIPRKILNKEIDELYKRVMLLQSMRFKDPNEYYKFMEKCFNPNVTDTISCRLINHVHFSDIVDVHVLSCTCSNVFGNTELLKGAMLCTNGNKLLKLIKFKALKV